MVHAHLRRRTASAAWVAIALLAACGGDPEDDGALADSTATTATSEVVQSVSTTAPAGADEDVRPLLRDTPLEAGVRYTTSDQRTGRGVRLHAFDGAFAYVDSGVVGLSADREGFQTVLSTYGLQDAHVLREDNPVVDETTDYLAVTDPAPEDYLGWLRTRPSFEVGPEVAATVDGRPARSATFRVVAEQGRTACGLPSGCVATIWIPGTTLVYAPGDSGTIYQFDVDGKVVLLELFDRPESAGLLESIEYFTAG